MRGWAARGTYLQLRSRRRRERVELRALRYRVQPVTVTSVIAHGKKQRHSVTAAFGSHGPPQYAPSGHSGRPLSAAPQPMKLLFDPFEPLFELQPRANAKRSGAPTRHLPPSPARQAWTTPDRPARRQAQRAPMPAARPPAQAVRSVPSSSLILARWLHGAPRPLRCSKARSASWRATAICARSLSSDFAWAAATPANARLDSSWSCSSVGSKDGSARLIEPLMFRS